MARLLTWQGSGPYYLFTYFFHAIFSLFNVFKSACTHYIWWKKKHKLRIQVLVSEMAPQRPLELLLKRPLKFLFGINIATHSYI